jgi:hypothetical protein
MTDYEALYPIMEEDLNEYDWMNVEWWLPRARSLATYWISKHPEIII